MQNSTQLVFAKLLPGMVCVPLTLASPGVAQVIPDGTLGIERSVVTPLDANTDRIEGGALRNSLLFHSFEGFSIPEGQGVYFANPEFVNTIFSRVTGADPSLLFGTLGVLGDADLMFINSNGIVFGPNVELDLRGSFTATTATEVLFPGGETFSALEPKTAPLLMLYVEAPVGVVFEGESPSAIANFGNLAVESRQSVTLIGGEIANNGILQAPDGHITMLATPGNTAVQLGDTGIVQGWTEIEDEAILFTGQSVAALIDTAELDTDALIVDAALFEPGTAMVSGELDAASDVGVGGDVWVLGDRISLVNATIDASGVAGGGEILIGGEYRGEGILPTAQSVSTNENSQITSDAIESGSGGQIILWADETARIDGTLSARGGVNSGDGGLIETSGRELLTLSAVPNASAVNGNGGTWLIDPTNITLASNGGGVGANIVDVANINAALNTGTNVIITTDIGGTEAGNITQESDALISKTSGEMATLSLQAANDIFLNADIASSSNQLNLELIADSDVDGAGSLNISTAQIDTNNGNLTGFGSGIFISNSADIATQRGEINITSNGLSNVLVADGLSISENSSINTSSGNINITSTGGIGNDISTFATGLVVTDRSEIRTDNGHITLIGTGGSNTENADGIGIGSGGVVEATQTGTITLVGTGGTGGDAQGIVIGFGNDGRIRSVDGDISLTGVAGGDGTTIIGDHGILILEGGEIASTGAGSIILNGTGGETGDQVYGIALSEGSLISSTTGNIDFEGNGGDGFGSGHRGIGIRDSQILTVDGDITLKGWGGDTSLNDNGGIAILNGLIQSTGNGSISLFGQVGNGNDPIDGVLLVAGVNILSEDGDIEIIGIGGVSDQNSFRNTGVEIASATNFGSGNMPASIESFGTGNIVISGRAGGITQSGLDQSSLSQGVSISGPPGTRIASNRGNISLIGDFQGNGSNTSGITIRDDNIIESVNGNIFLEGSTTNTLSDILITNNLDDSQPFSIVSGDSITLNGVMNLLGNSLELIAGENITINDGGIYGSGFNSSGVVFDAGAQVLLSGGDVRSQIFGPGTGQDINISADIVTFRAGGRIVTGATGDGRSGHVVVNTRQLNIQGIELGEGDRDDFATGIGTNALRGGSGESGDITINASESVEINGQRREPFVPDITSRTAAIDVGILQTGITASSLGTGKAGDINVDTGLLVIRDGAGIATAALGLLESDAGAGGNLNIRAREIELRGLAGLATASIGTGRAGDITIRGIDSENELASVEQISILDGAAITADAIPEVAKEIAAIVLGSDLVPDSIQEVVDQLGGLDRLLEIAENDAQTRAGNVDIAANSILLDNLGRITTSSTTGNGGNITLRDVGVLRLRRGGLPDGRSLGGIFTDGGANNSIGDGGFIDITANTIFAVNEENTDISARAFLGTGGGIRVRVNFIQGIDFRDPPTLLSDITIASEFGQSGTADIELTAVDPTQGVSTLPDEPRGPEVIESCTVRGNTEAVSFFDLGRGGRFPGPDDLITNDAIIVEWASLDLIEATRVGTAATARSPLSLTPDFRLLATCGPLADE